MYVCMYVCMYVFLNREKKETKIGEKGDILKEYKYIYIYIYVCVCVCVCVDRQIFKEEEKEIYSDWSVVRGERIR